jgi:transglutaminase-like putative cysteine protease
VTTATPTRPAGPRPAGPAAPVPGGPAPTGGQPAPPDGGAGPLLWAEGALALLTLSAVLGLGRLVDSRAWLGTVLLCTLLAHGLAAVARRRRWPAPVVGLTALVGLVVALGILHAPGTTFGGVPTLGTLQELHRQLVDAGRSFSTATPPAPLEPGYVVAWSAAAWVVALTADAAAFRARATFESIVPAGSLFVFASALGSGRYRVPATVAFLAAALLAWLTQRLVGRARTSRWVGAGGGSGLLAVAGPGLALAVAAVVVTALVAPRLPGAGAEALVHWDHRAPSTRVTISPLVDLRTRLVDESTIEVFTVTSDVRSYWRLTALDDFDGRVWSSDNRYRPLDGRFTPDDAPRAQTVRADQTFHITGLESAWLPAAFRAVSVSGVGARYDAGSSTWLADDDTNQGETYRAVSLVPVVTAGELSGPAASVPSSIQRADTALPDDFPARVTDLARSVVAGAQTPFEVALRLQDYLRSSAFTYDLDVGQGESNHALEEFLFDTHTGYCEQFAGSFAAMARSIGLPARVAVGFTPGDQVGPDTYRVLGLHGHAWPEVYLAGFGWVPFEPTPGRGIPGAESYTGVPESQASGGSVPTTVPAPGATADRPGATTTVPAPAASPSGRGSGGPTVAAWLVVAAAVVLAPLAWVLLLDAGRRLLRRRRIGSARDAADRVVLAWREAVTALARAGLPRRPSETPAEFAARAAASGLAPLGPIAELARMAAAAVYAGRPLSREAGDRAVDLAATVDEEVGATRGRWRRLAARLDPRTLRLAPGG